MTEKSGRLAIVTGGASGIGAAIAERFVADGLTVAVIDKDKPKTENGGQLAYFQTDLSSAFEVERAVTEIVQKFGRLDVLVNNAGLTLPRSIDDTSTEDWDMLQAVNLRAVFLTTKYLLPFLKAAKEPAIVNVASFHAVATIENFSAYAASKSGVIGLTRSSALELAQYGIRVNAVCPGIVHTSMVDTWLETQSDQAEALGRMVEKQPLGRLGRPHEIAAAAAFLASSEASYITGTSIVVDGGVSARLWHA